MVSPSQAGHVQTEIPDSVRYAGDMTCAHLSLEVPAVTGPPEASTRIETSICFTVCVWCGLRSAGNNHDFCVVDGVGQRLERPGDAMQVDNTGNEWRNVDVSFCDRP